jgi:hypothetical protein
MDSCMTQDQALVAKSVVDRLARRTKVKCWWASLEDLRQEGWLAACAAMRNFKPDGEKAKHEGDHGALGGYLWRAVERGMTNWLWANTAPVSASWHFRTELGGITRTGLTRGPGSGDGASVRAVCPYVAQTPDAEATMEVGEWQAEAARVVAAAFARVKDGQLAKAVLLDDRRHGEVAKEAGVPIARVVTAVKAARVVLAEDEDFAFLLEEGRGDESPWDLHGRGRRTH